MSEIVLGNEFFAPAPSDLVDNLIGRYKTTRETIECLAGILNGPEGNEAIPYFLRGNQDGERYIRPISDIFKLEGAIANLNAAYWQQALSLTDVYEYMPQKRRDEWDDQIREMKTPEFEEETVRPTIMSLLNSPRGVLIKGEDDIAIHIRYLPLSKYATGLMKVRYGMFLRGSFTQ